MFKTITDDSTLSGQRIVSVLKARKIAQEEVNISLQKHIAQLELDKAALTKLEQKVASGTSYEKAYAKSMEKASNDAKNYAIQTKGAAGTTDTFVAKQKAAQTELEATATSSKLASAGVKILSTAFNMFAGIAVTWVFTKIIEGFEYLGGAAERAKEKLEEIQTKLSDNSSSYESNRKALVDLKDEYNTLTKKAEILGGTQNLANEEYERYQEITSQILGITPKLITGWNDEGQAISNKNNLLQRSIDLLDEEYEKSLRNNTTKSKNEEVASGVITKVNEFENDPDTKTRSGTTGTLENSFINELKKLENKGYSQHDIVEQMWQYLDPEDYNNKINDFWADHIDTYSELYDLIRKDKDKLAKSFTDKNNPIYNLFSDEVIDNMIRNADAYFEEGQRIIDDREALYQDYKDQLNWNAQATNDKNGNNSYKQLTDNGKAFISEYIEGLDYASIKTEDDFVEMANNVQKFTRLLASNDDVAHVVEDIFTPAKEDETSEEYVNRVQNAIDDIQKYCIDNNINLPINFTTISDVNRMDKSVKDLLRDEFDARVGELTLDDLQIAAEKIEVSEGTLLSWDELKQKISEAKNAANETNTSKPKTFKSVWNSIGTTGDDDAKKKALEEKERLEELAEAGKLTEKELSKSYIADEFTKAGVSIEKATKKINKFVEETKQLSALRTGITSITSAYDEKKDSKKKTVSASTLDSMGDTLGVSDWGEKNQKVWENYKNVAGSGKKTLKELRDAQNQLASAYINSSNFLANLNSENADYYEGLLKEMGIINAHEIIANKAYKDQKNLAVVKKELGVESDDLKDASVSEVAALYDVDAASEEASKAMYNLMTSKIAAGNVKISTSDDCNNLLRMAEAAGIATNKLRALLNAQIEFDLSDRQTTDANSLQDAINSSSGNGEVSYVNSNGTKRTYSSKKSAMSALSHLRKNAKSNKDKAANNVDKWIKKHKDDDVKVSLSDGNKSNGSTGGKKDKSSKTKKSKQEINWLERRLTRMQNIIDLTASKLQNLFSVNAKNSNLNKQIKQSTKLMNQYGIAAKRYQDKADSIAKGKKKGKKKTKPLSKSIIKKIRSGKITKADYSELIKKYGQSYANRINSYIDYYDKAQDAKKNKQDTRAKIRELQIDQQKNIQDDADKKIEKYQAQRENALLKDKNNTIKSQIDEIERSYKAQIEIAKLEEDTETEAKLRTEKQKALNDLYQEEIDNIKANTDAKIKVLDTGTVDKNGKRTYGRQYYDNQISYTEASGGIVDKQWYREQNKLREDEIKEAQTGLNQIITKIGNFAEGTQEWYNAQSDRADYEKAINDAKIAQIENTKAMRALTEAMEEKYDQWYSNFNSELSFLSSLQSGDHADSDTGTFTDSGNLGIYTQTLTYKSANAEKDYWRDQTTALKGLIDRKASIEEIKSAGFEFESLEDAEKALDDYYQKWQEAISTEKSAEESIVDLMKEKYEAQKDYLQDIIDAKKESLQIEKDLYDYSKNIANKTKNVATLQKQINALRGDTSEEGRARLAKLQVSLDEAQQDLKDTEYERFISSQQNMLDNMMKQYDDLLTRLYKNRDKILADGFNYVNDNIKSLSSLLSTTAETYDYTMTSGLSTVNTSLGTGATTIGSHIDTSGKTAEEIRDAIKGMKGDDPSSVVGLLQSLPGKIIEEYKNKDSGTKDNGGGNNGGGGGNHQYESGGNTVIDQYGNVINNGAIGEYGETLHKINDYLNAHGGNPTSTLNKLLKEKTGWYISNKNDNADLKEISNKLGVKYDGDYSENGNVYKYLKEHGFQTGGIVRANGVPLKGDNIPIRVNPNETVLTQKFTDMLPQTVDIMKDFANIINIPKFQPNNQTTSNSIGEVNFHMDINPENFPDFVNQLQNDQRVRQTFSVAVKDLVKSGKITSNIQRY